jgi:hypothetical protein
MASVQVNTNGQTLTVNASVSHWTTAALAVTASAANDVESTTTTTITSNYVMHFSNTATTAAITVKQLDGTTLYAGTVDVSAGTGPRVLNPLPDEYQQAADAGNVPFTHTYISGSYYWAGHQHGSAPVAITAAQLRLTPYYVASPLTIAAIGMSVTGAGGAGSVVRIGIYSDNGAGYPGALFSDCGTIDGTSATVQEIDVNPDLSLARGLYWFGAVAQVGTLPTVRCGAAAVPPSIILPLTWGTVAPATSDMVGGYQQASVTGALPATFTTTPSPQYPGNLPRIHFKTA